MKILIRSIIQFLFVNFSLITISLASTQMVVGLYGTQTEFSLPLVMLGNETGQSWTFVKNISGFPAGTRGGQVRHVSCVGDNCIAAGSYEHNTNTDLSAFSPLLLKSSDKGASWSFVNTISYIPDNVTHAYLDTVDCQDSACIAAGYADTLNEKTGTDLEHPLLLMSNDSGQTWRFVNGGTLDLPHMDGSFYGITRNNGNWILIGSYDVYPSGSQVNPTQYPLFLISKDDGKSWTQLNENSGLPSMSLLEENPEALVECADNICLTGGSSATQKNYIPLILRSDDSSQSWSIIKNISGMPPRTLGSKERGSPSISQFSCTENNCVAVGDWNWGVYTPYHPTIPFVILSRDKGLSWARVKNIDGFPVFQEHEPFLSTVSCADNFCAAGGEYGDKLNITKLPLLIVSRDKGESWTLIKNISGLPSNFNDAAISSIHCADNSCTVIGVWTTDTYYSLPLIMITNDSGQSWSFIRSITDLPENTNRAELVSVVNNN